MRARGIDAFVTAVAGTADAFDDGVDAVAVALGVGETFAHDHAHAFTDQHAVGLVVERADAAFAGEGGCFAETHVHERRVVGIDTAGDDHIAGAFDEFADGHFGGAERSGAGGIHHTVESAQVEAVGDAAGDDVAEQTREGVFRPRNVGRLDLFNDRFDLVFRNAVCFQCFAPDGVLQPGDERGDHFLTTAYAEDDTRTFAEGCMETLGAGRIAGIEEGIACDGHTQQLGGVGRLEQVWGQTKLHRVEINFGKKASYFAIGFVGRERICVKVVIGVPSVVGHFADAVDTLNDVLPILLQIFGVGENGSHTDNGYRVLSEERRDVCHFNIFRSGRA